MKSARYNVKSTYSEDTGQDAHLLTEIRVRDRITLGVTQISSISKCVGREFPEMNYIGSVRDRQEKGREMGYGHRVIAWMQGGNSRTTNSGILVMNPVLSR